MTRLRVRLLGAFQVTLEGVPITQFESNKVRALLAYLAVEHHQAHSREKLAALLWPEMPSRRSSSNLSQALYNLRRLIQDQQAQPPYLLRERAAVQFNRCSDFWLDVDAFNQALDGHSPSDPPHPTFTHLELKDLQTALDLYQGDFLEGFTFDGSNAFDEWLIILRQRLQRRAIDGYHHLAEALSAQGDLEAAFPYAWRQVALDPLNESAYRQLMRLLADSGKRNQALAQFERLQVMLAEELMVAPEPATIRLRDQIRADGHRVSQAPIRRNNLPAFLTPMIGRQQEMMEIKTRLEQPDCRLLTILGPGGSGKTRLALEVARSRLERFSHGVYFVALNPVQSPASILPAVVNALDLPGGEKEKHQAQLANYLRKKSLLLLLDGFEHLLAGAGMLVEILREAPGLKILVTSRTRLNIKSENLYLLAGMEYPEDTASQVEILTADAVELLLANLKRVQQAYEPAAEDLKHLLQICRQIQGMPLGIMLAASWGATYSIAEVAERVSQSLDFLVADWTDVPARQRSLRATFDHSWNLLDERQRHIFQSITVFRGVFSRDAARVISGATHYELRALVDRSLLWNKTSGWYEVHELLRQYGREKLAQSAEVEQKVCNRHSSHYLSQLARLGDGLNSDQQEASLGRIDLEHENYRAAWNWASGQGAWVQIAQVLEALCQYYDLRLRYQDGESACRTALNGIPQDSDTAEVRLLLARILTWQSCFTRLLGQPDVAFQLLDQGKGYFEKTKATEDQFTYVEAFLTLEQGNNYFHRNRTAATQCYQHSLHIYRGLGDSWGIAKALSRLGIIAHHAGIFQEAVEIYTECLELHRTLGDPRGIANALIELGQNALRLGQTEQGERYINEGVAVLRQIGDRAGIARGYFELGRYLFWSGDSARCLPLIEESSQIFEDLGMLDKYIFASIGIGLGLSHLGMYTETITRVVKNIPLAQELDARREIGMAYVILGMANLGQGNFEQAENWALKSIKQYRDINQQEELGLALTVLIYTHLGLGQSQQAGLSLCETLQIGIDTRGLYPLLYILFAASLLLIKRGEIEMALEIAALAKRYPFVGNSRWFEDIAGREITVASKTLPPKVIAAAQERGQKRDIWETAEALLDQFLQE
jgi:DNA-binding SARP family transcriptional activator/predicted ATPase